MEPLIALPNVQVVGPGDPTFSATSEGNIAPNPVTTPAVPQSLPNQNTNNAPVPDPAVGSDLDEEDDKPVPTLTQAEFDKRLAAAQSTLDKRIGSLDKQNAALLKRLDDQDAAHQKAVRDNELALTPEHERQALMRAWESEDARKALDKKAEAVTDLYRNVEGVRLLAQYGEWVTEDDILGFEGSPTDMEAWVKGLAFDRSQSGEKPAGAKVSSRAAPGGATAAHQDIGNTPLPLRGSDTQLRQDQGVDAMAANVRTLFSSGPDLPWQTPVRR
jgi:hypothetical protein